MAKLRARFMQQLPGKNETKQEVLTRVTEFRKAIEPEDAPTVVVCHSQIVNAFKSTHVIDDGTRFNHHGPVPTASVHEIVL